MILLSHPLYLAPLPLYVQLYNSSAILFDAGSPYVKQTHRSRAVIATENGKQSLTIPVVHDGGSIAMRDVRISEHGNWRHRHWNAIVSAYRKSPFFDYYADDFAHFYEERDGFLMDFNLRLHNTVCELLGLEREVRIIDSCPQEMFNDLRCIAEPRELERDTTCRTKEYYQVFSQRNGFIPNLSIADLLFNMGPEGLITLKESCL